MDIDSTQISDRTKGIFKWISNITSSCTDDFHFEAVDNLVELFHEREKNDDLYSELKHLRHLKWNEIHGIIAPHLNK